MNFNEISCLLHSFFFLKIKDNIVTCILCEEKNYSQSLIQIKNPSNCQCPYSQNFYKCKSTRDCQNEAIFFSVDKNISCCHICLYEKHKGDMSFDTAPKVFQSALNKIKSYCSTLEKNKKVKIQSNEGSNHEILTLITESEDILLNKKRSLDTLEINISGFQEKISQYIEAKEKKFNTLMIVSHKNNNLDKTECFEKVLNELSFKYPKLDLFGQMELIYKNKPIIEEIMRYNHDAIQTNIKLHKKDKTFDEIIGKSEILFDKSSKVQTSINYSFLKYIPNKFSRLRRFSSFDIAKNFFIGTSSIDFNTNISVNFVGVSISGMVNSPVQAELIIYKNKEEISTQIINLPVIKSKANPTIMIYLDHSLYLNCHNNYTISVKMNTNNKYHDIWLGNKKVDKKENQYTVKPNLSEEKNFQVKFKQSSNESDTNEISSGIIVDLFYSVL